MAMKCLRISLAVLIDILTFQIEIHRQQWIFHGSLNPWITLFHPETPCGLEAECFEPHLSLLYQQSHLLYLLCAPVTVRLLQSWQSEADYWRYYQWQ